MGETYDIFDYAVAQQAKSGKEATVAVLGLVGSIAVSALLLKK